MIEYPTEVGANDLLVIVTSDATAGPPDGWEEYRPPWYKRLWRRITLQPIVRVFYGGRQALDVKGAPVTRLKLYRDLDDTK